MYTDKITQAVAEAVKQILATEKLHPNQQKLDVHEPEKDELTSNDFKMLRKGKKADVKEGWQDMLDDVKKRAGPQPSGGSGVKQGSRYGGSKQKDEPEDKKPMKEDIEQLDELSPELLFHASKVAQAKSSHGRALHYKMQANRFRTGFYSAYDRDKKNGTYDQRKAAALKNEEVGQIDELAISPQARASAKERETSYHDDTEFPARSGQDLSGHTVSKLKTMHRHHLMTAGYADVSNPEEKGEYHNAMKSARRIKNEIDRRKSVKKEEVGQIDELAISPQARADAKAREKDYHDQSEFPVHPERSLVLHTTSKLKSAYSHHSRTAADPIDKSEGHNAVKAMRRLDREFDKRKIPQNKRFAKEEVDINAINGVKMSNVDESSHQAKTTMKHIPNASPELKKAAKDIKPGIAGFRDRVAMLKAGGVKQ